MFYVFSPFSAYFSPHYIVVEKGLFMSTVSDKDCTHPHRDICNRLSMAVFKAAELCTAQQL